MEMRSLGSEHTKSEVVHAIAETFRRPDPDVNGRAFRSRTALRDNDRRAHKK